MTTLNDTNIVCNTVSIHHWAFKLEILLSEIVDSFNVQLTLMFSPVKQ